MDADGGMSQYPTSKAGAKTTSAGLEPVPTRIPVTTTRGRPTSSPLPTLLTLATLPVLTAAPATSAVPQAATAGVCAPDGFATATLTARATTTPYGPGKTVDTTKEVHRPAAATGNRLRDNGVVIANSINNIVGMPAVNSITQAYCDAEKSVFGDTTSFQHHRDLVGMGKSLAPGGVLVLSVWDDLCSEHASTYSGTTSSTATTSSSSTTSQSSSFTTTTTATATKSSSSSTTTTTTATTATTPRTSSTTTTTTTTTTTSAN
ncbi:hypothetical protein FRC05_009137, partial [Tulasnella sp. 425]